MNQMFLTALRHYLLYKLLKDFNPFKNFMIK